MKKKEGNCAVQRTVSLFRNVTNILFTYENPFITPLTCNVKNRIFNLIKIGCQNCSRVLKFEEQSTVLLLSMPSGPLL